MYLYDRKENEIKIYKFLPNKEKFYDYKKEQIETIREEFRLLHAVTNCRELQCLGGNEESIWYNKLQYFETGLYGGSSNHSLEPYNLTIKELERQKNILEEYYKTEGEFKFYKIKYVVKAEKLEYLLLLEPYYKEQINRNGDSYYIMDNIVNLPYPLFKLQKFISLNLNELNNDEINEFINLYEFDENYDSINVNMLKRFDNYGITKFDEEKLNRKIEQSQKVLSLIK